MFLPYFTFVVVFLALCLFHAVYHRVKNEEFNVALIINSFTLLFYITTLVIASTGNFVAARIERVAYGLVLLGVTLAFAASFVVIMMLKRSAVHYADEHKTST